LSLPRNVFVVQQVTFRLPEQQVEQVDELVENGEWPNRSEAVRHAVREWLDDD
jgi:Arc/MetJ-type ribon-helix-helix transcriptional regulator